MDEKKPYLPKLRSYYDPNNELKGPFEDGSSSFCENPDENPIVANNIAWQEGDYTEDMLEDTTED